MKFPRLNLWPSTRREDQDLPIGQASDQIDRTLENRQHRLALGLAVDREFKSVNGCLLVAQGRGKFLRFKHAIGGTSEIPNSIREALVRLVAEVGEGNRASENPIADLELTLRDLAEIQAKVVGNLKLSAGKYVDRILAVAVEDPGLWLEDFDGSLSYRGLCHADRLAESTGLNVIDQLPARDLSVGGSGRRLDALPLWMMLSDRSPKTATVFRSLLQFRRQPVGGHLVRVDLPPSDGLDAELPEVGYDAILVEPNQPVSALKQFLAAPDLTPFRSRGDCRHQWVLDNSVEDSVSMEANLSSEVIGETETYPLSGLIGDAVPVDALVSAVLGLFHIDQLPANIPELTGATSQRMLGRLTPGRPSNWRQLIRAMAQYYPAPMKLKDAV